jgi:hypothetical protein
LIAKYSTGTFLENKLSKLQDREQEEIKRILEERGVNVGGSRKKRRTRTNCKRNCRKTKRVRKVRRTCRRNCRKTRGN